MVTFRKLDFIDKCAEIIYGDMKILHKYTIETEEDIINIPLAENTDNARPGMSIYVYRKKYKGEKFIESFLLYKDFYPPVYIK